MRFPRYRWNRGKGSGPGEQNPAEALPVSSALRQVLNEAMVQGGDRTALERSGPNICSRAFWQPVVPPRSFLRVAGLNVETLRERLTEAVTVDHAPLPLAEGIPPLELNRAGRGRRSGANSGRIRQSRGKDCGSSKTMCGSCSMIPG